MAPVEGIEPPLTVLETAALPLHHTGIVGCGVLDSNQGSSAYEADGMTTSLTRNKTWYRFLGTIQGPPPYQDGALPLS
ncbi:MAG: hypothetical protein RLZZ382_1962 [Bacteroidota bacterium]|jgi:hypothetical protein